MKTARLWLEVRARFGVDLPLRWLGADATPAQLLARIAQEPGVKSVPKAICPLHLNPDPNKRYHPYPLTPMQESYLIGKQSELQRDTIGCLQYLEFAVSDVDLTRLRQAWQRIVDQQDMLRTVVTDEGMQRVLLQTPPIVIQIHDLTSVATDQIEARLERVRQKLVQRRHTTTAWPPFAIEVSLLAPSRALVHFSLDMLVTDAHGLALLLEQWHTCYEQPDSMLPATVFSARDCVIALQAHSGTLEYQNDLAYWVDKLRDLPPGPLLPAAHPDSPDIEPGQLQGSLSQNQWLSLRARAKAANISPSSFILALFARVFGRGRDPFSIVVTTNLRPWLPSQADNLVGPFTSFAIIIVKEALQSVEKVARQLQAQLWDALQHGSCPGVAVLRQVRSQQLTQGPITPVVFTSLIGVGPGGCQDRGFGRNVTRGLCLTSGVTLENQIWEQNGELRYRWDVASREFITTELENQFAAFENSLQASSLTPQSFSRKPLNDLQQAYYFARTSHPDLAWNGCQIYESFECDDVDLPRLESALLSLIRDCEALRTIVSADGELEVRCDVPDRWHVPLVNLDSVTDPAASLNAIRDEMAGRAFVFGVWPPFDVRVTKIQKKSIIHCSFDLAVFDARSIHILCRELLRRYANTDLSSYLTPRRDSTERDAVESLKERSCCDSHWERRLAQLQPGPELPVRLSPEHHGRRIRLRGQFSAWNHLVHGAEQHKLSPDMLLLAAYLEVLSIHLQARAFSVPVVRFPRAAERCQPGEFTAMSWVQCSMDGSLLERATAYQRVIADDIFADSVSGLRHLRPFVMRERRNRDFAFPVVYTTVLDLTEAPLPRGIRAGDWLSCTPDVALDCIGICEGGSLFFCWDAVEENFLPGQLLSMFGDYQRFLEQLTLEITVSKQQDDQDDNETEDPENHPILYSFNDTTESFPTDRLPHQFFENCAAQQPEAIALRGRDWTRTYADLNREANYIAWHLKTQGVGSEKVVGLAVRRGASMIAAYLGVLKAGGVCLPIDPSLPEERAALLLTEARAMLLLTTSDSHDWHLTSSVRVVCLDTDIDTSTTRHEMEFLNPTPAVCADNTAYIIFTSGSTGKPKGVAVAHRAILNLLHWSKRTFNFGVGDLGLCVTSLAFDLSTFDIFGLLGVGGGLYVADETERRDPQLLLGIILANPITFWNSAPILLSQLAPLLASVRGKPGTEQLRLVFLSGDFIPISLPNDIRSVFPRARIVNLGGATEATVWSNFFVVETVDPTWRSIPYGRPIDNARYHVLDAELKPLAVGSEGDLYIGGECLSEGYYMRPDLTAERFIPDPFTRYPSQRLYYTGDRACYLPDGNLSLLGRVDSQVKIRGFRVELGEIEHCLRQHPGVKEVFAVVRPDQRGDDPKIVAYVEAAQQSPPHVKDLRSYAARVLPDYMVPNFISFVDRFPATANGKLDREALPWPLELNENSAEKNATTTDVTQLQREIAARFAEMLGISTFDGSKDIWNQGATSFTVVRVSNWLQERYGLRIPISTVLSDPTVNGIATWLAAELAENAGSGGLRSDLIPAPEQDISPVPVDFFSKEERERFKCGQWGLRPLSTDEPLVTLRQAQIADEYYSWRSSRRDLLDSRVSYESFSRLLSLLSQCSIDGRTRRLYPSAGDTFAVQVYLHIRAGRVEGIEPGVYYYRSAEHALQLVNRKPELDRAVHFYYNRSLYDSAAFELYLIGQARGIEPIYRENAARYLALEAGHISQLLMVGQAACQIGLCPIGDLAFDGIRDQLHLDAGHCFLLSMLGGRAEHTRATVSTGELPPFARNWTCTRAADVAVIGLAGRYPGADDPEALWDKLIEGEQAFTSRPILTKVPKYRSAHQKAGFIRTIDEFDCLLFHISPAEAETLDPQMRLLLETVWACLENAGYSPKSLRRTAGRVGVIVGSMWQDYHQVGAECDEFAGGLPVSGSGSDTANRVSQYFDFQGPSLALDTACTSAVAAIHLAVESIRRGECDAVVVGAVNLLLHPYHFKLLSELGLTTDCPADAFAADSSGWTPGEGVIAMLLRPATAAVTQGDVVHGVIEATAVGHVGRLGGSDPDALATSIKEMLAAQGLSPGDISYVECAAGGSSVSDAAEVEALAKVFDDSERQSKVIFGTLKANIGHLEAAAGLSQLTKVLLQLRHRQIAPTRVAERRNPLVNWDELPLTLADRVHNWSSPSPETPIRALINALGANGSHGHVVVRSAPLRQPALPRKGDQLIVLSAATSQQLVTLSKKLRDHLSACQLRAEAPDLADIAYTLQTGRVQLAHRLAICCSDIPSLLARLDDFAKGRTQAGVAGVAATWMAGEYVDWDREWDHPARRVSLPTYPFSGRSYWIGSSKQELEASEAAAGQEEKGLLDNFNSAVQECSDVFSKVEGVKDHLLRLYAELSGIAREDLDAAVPLEHYGLNSLLSLRFSRLIERDFGAIPSILFRGQSSLADVAENLFNLRRKEGKPKAAELGGTYRQPPRQRQEPEMAIAIVGVAGRYPQARDLDQFWTNLVSGRDCITALPAERRREGWPIDLMWGGFLDDVDLFDSLLFNITPREADLMDPQARIFLEVVWEALDDAGYPGHRLRERHGSRVGVYVGSMYNEYPLFGVEHSLRGQPESSGAGPADIANRVSYFFNLCGPSMTVDTLCSSSLTSIHLAVESLRRGECEVAIVGGVNLSLHPNKFLEQSRHKMPSSDHRCRSFGAGGDGFAPGEGVGAVILKLLPAAEADGDRIHAVIKGTAVNHGGRTSGYMVPNPAAQSELIRSALQVAGVAPSTISYLEAHGTGTEVGDPIEISGLEQAFAGEKPVLGRWPIGSVKSSIGHLEGAAGIASLTKVILQLRYKQFVPSLHAEQLNPNVDWQRSVFDVQRQVEEWCAAMGEDGRPIPRRAGISSFGAGGANAHIVVEEYGFSENRPPFENQAAGPHLIVLSAREREGLQAAAGRLAAFVKDHTVPLPDLAYTLQVGREHLRERLALIVSSAAELSAKLSRFSVGESADVIRGRCRMSQIKGSSSASDQVKGFDLVSLAQRWVEGGTVDWSELWGAQMPRLLSLPSYPFSRRRHWVPWEGCRCEITPKSLAPAYRKIWKPTNLTSSRSLAEGPVICLFQSESEAVARQILDYFGQREVLLIREGPDLRDGISSFSDLSSGLSLIERILATHPLIVAWLDLCDLYQPENKPGLWLARLAMLQRLLQCSFGKPVRVLHVSRGLQDLEGTPPSMAGGRIAGFIRMLGSEDKKVTGTIMDTDLSEGDAVEAARQIGIELGCGDAAEVCYRRGLRYQAQLQRTELSVKELRLDPTQVYVVTGGVRGLGALVARRLVQRGARMLALTGLRPLPPRKLWDSPGLPLHEVEAVKTIRDLESAGAKVDIYCGALTQRADVDAFLARARGQGDIGGIVHCAGRLSDDRRPFCRRDLTDFRSVFEPKVEGLESLAELCSCDRPSFFLLFSSVCAAVPKLAAGVAEYAAANAFMDWFASHQARKGRTCYRSAAWPSWRGVGTAPESPIYGRLGLNSIEVEEGLSWLEAVIGQPDGGSLLVCPGDRSDSQASAWLDSFENSRVPEAAVRPPVTADVPIPNWLCALFARSLGMAENELDPHTPFSELGVESVLLADLLQQIEAKVGRSLEPNILLEHPTIALLSSELSERGISIPSQSHVDVSSTARGTFCCLSAKSSVGARQIAVIGMACHFPGAPSTAQFWANLKAGHCSITEVPLARWDHRSLYCPNFEIGKSISKWGGFVDAIEEFDASHFRMSDEEATCLDPAIRLMLEGAETCIADAGYTGPEVWGRNIGVFVGARISDYWRRTGPRAGRIGFGSDQNFIAARVADHLNLSGPNFVLDSACSSSLVSLQVAVGSLLTGGCEAALVAGVEVLLDERPYVEFTAARALSPTGTCYTFDERADGFVPGEGCGVILLKPLDHALRDGDPIHAVIESVAVNNDGRTMGLTTPNPAAQAAVIRCAIEQSGVHTEDIAMVEAHGTGTMLGDPIELRALSEVFGKQTGKKSKCAVGSVKSNLGHLLSAAGMAGFIKAVLSLEHGEIPPTLNCEHPNPRFDFESSPFFPNTALRVWPTDRKFRAAGISAFGLGGTNAHVVATAFESSLRPAMSQVRCGFPLPIFRRRRLWLDRLRSGEEEAARVGGEGELIASILDLEFV